MVRRSPSPLHSSQRKKWLTILQSSAAKKKLGETSQKPLRIVLDTNVWYSAIVHGGNAEAAVLYSLENAEVVLSVEIVDELYDLLRNFLKVPYRWLNGFMRLLEEVSEVVANDSAATVETEVRDPKDMHVLAAAVSGDVQVIITGDKDLLALEQDELLILNAADFISIAK